MPGNGLAFAVRVGSEVHRTRILNQGCQPFEHVFAALRGSIRRGEVRQGNAQLALRQIAHMANGRGHFPIDSQNGLYFFDLAG